MWAYSLTNDKKIAILGINFPLRENFGRSTEKVEYRCTSKTPYSMQWWHHNCFENYTASYSVSVITNFVVPKRDKQTDRQKTSHFFVYSRRATHDPHHTWHGDSGGPCHFWPPQLVFDSISSFAARGYWSFEGKCPHHRKILITWLFVPRKHPN